jgi:RNA polymerase sigma-70 factor (ECF subfamily)
MKSDEQLMEECRGGGKTTREAQREAFAELFRRYRQRIYGYFRRRVSSPARAEELAQETFVAVLEAAPRWEQRAHFRTWLFGIAFNLCMAERRKSANDSAFASAAEAGATADDPPEALRVSGCGVRTANNPDDVLWVRAAIAQLDDDHREVLLLREYEELRYDEIAEVTGVPVNTVRSRLFRARLALKELLVPEGMKPPMNADTRRLYS